MTKKPILKVERNSKLLDLVNLFPQNLDSLKIKMQNSLQYIRNSIYNLKLSQNLVSSHLLVCEMHINVFT